MTDVLCVSAGLLASYTLQENSGVYVRRRQAFVYMVDQVGRRGGTLQQIDARACPSGGLLLPRPVFLSGASRLFRQPSKLGLFSLFSTAHHYSLAIPRSFAHVCYLLCYSVSVPPLRCVESETDRF